MDINYKEKYLKYKVKYFKLKNSQKGGSSINNDLIELSTNDGRKFTFNEYEYDRYVYTWNKYKRRGQVSEENPLPPPSASRQQLPPSSASASSRPTVPVQIEMELRYPIAIQEMEICRGAKSIFETHGQYYAIQFDNGSQYFNSQSYLDLKIRDLENFTLSHAYKDNPGKLLKIKFLARLMEGYFESRKIVHGESENFSIGEICKISEHRKTAMFPNLKDYEYISRPVEVNQTIDEEDASKLYPTGNIDQYYQQLADSVLPSSGAAATSTSRKASASSASSDTSLSDALARSRPRGRDRSRGSDRSRMLRTPSPDERSSASRSDSASSNPFQGTTLDLFGLRGKQ